MGPYSSDSLSDLGDARTRLEDWARDNGIAYGRESARGTELACALEHFKVGPVDESDFTKWETEFAYLIA
jgi:hypothetical protein